MPISDNLVHETSTSTGSGDVTLANENGKRSFNTAFSTGGTDKFWYFGQHRTAAEWELGSGHLSAASTLVRDTIIASSNGGSAVVWSAGTKDFTSAIPYAFLAQLDANGNLQFADGKGLADANGNEILKVLKTASAINEVQITNAAIGNPPVINPSGGDTNIDLKLDGKGTGGLIIGGATGKGQGTLNTQNGLYEGGYRIGGIVLSEGAIAGTPSKVSFVLQGYRHYRIILTDLQNNSTSSGDYLNWRIATGPTATPVWNTTTYSYIVNRYRQTSGTGTTVTHSYYGKRHYSQFYTTAEVPYVTDGYFSSVDLWIFDANTPNQSDVGMIQNHVSYYNYEGSTCYGWNRLHGGITQIQAFGYSGFSFKRGRYTLMGYH